MINLENDYFDGEEFITFNVVSYNPPYKEITLAVTNRGKISHITYTYSRTDSEGFILNTATRQTEFTSEILRRWRNMKLTLKNIKELKRGTDSKLQKTVYNYVIEKWGNYDDKKYIFTDVLYHGCVSGIVGSLIYYSDTVAFYKQHRKEINDLLYECMSCTGIYSLSDMFGKNWDNEDPLVTDIYNQNLLAWFGFEETLRNIGNNFEVLRECI